MKRFFVAILAACLLVGAAGVMQAQEAQDLKKKLQISSLDFSRLKERYALNEEPEEEKGNITHPGASKLKLSGEIRIREEVKNHIYSSTDPNGRDGYDFLHMRTRLRFDINVMERLDAIIEFQDARTLGTPTTRDDEGVGLKRGEILVRDLLVENTTFEAGRFVMFYGDQRLIGHLEWKDEGRTYDGVRFSYKPEGAFVDVFGIRTLDQATSDADDRDLFGVYAGKELTEILDIEGYALLFRDQVRGTLRPLNLDERRFITLGVRADGGKDNLDFTGEFAYQHGDVGPGDLRAMAFALRAGYTFTDEGLKPRIGFELDHATGDRSQNDMESEQFQHLFPTGHLHYGYADLMAWSNMWDYRTSFSIKPKDEVSLSFDWHHLMFADTDGWWIDAGGKRVRGPANGASRHLGEETDFTVTWTPWKSLSFLAGWSHFFPGGYLHETGSRRDADFVYLQGRVVF